MQEDPESQKRLTVEQAAYKPRPLFDDEADENDRLQADERIDLAENTQLPKDLGAVIA